MMAVLAFGAAVEARAETLSVPGAKVSYERLSGEQAKSLAETVAAARVIYANDFDFDMPQTVTMTVACGPGNPTRLFNDGRDRINLSIASSEALARPAKSGVFHLYGLCHELGHVAMYRVLKDRDWLNVAGAEGWAHYAGSIVVDKVWAAKGEKLWWDAYDYRADGTARFEKQLAAADASDIDRAAGKWRELDAIIGPREFVKLFAAWQGAEVDPSAATKKLLPVLLATFPEKKEELEKWWDGAAPLLVHDRPASAFTRVEIAPGKLEGKAIELKEDDNTADGKRSIAGGGHARLFTAPAEGEWYLRSVSVHGARYGPVAAPADQFDVALCDEQMRPIAVWKHPYKLFERGAAKWVRIDVAQPTLVPAKFNLCVVFRPTAQNGVFVSYDSSTKGNSQVATPGEAGKPLEQGDWMIRVELDRAKGAGDAFRAR